METPVGSKISLDRFKPGLFLVKTIPGPGDVSIYYLHYKDSRLGVLIQRKNRHYPKQIGWQSLSTRYWIGLLYTKDILVALTQKELINQILIKLKYLGAE